MGFKCTHTDHRRQPIHKANLRIDWNKEQAMNDRFAPKVYRTSMRWFKGTAKLISNESIRIAVESGDPSSITGIFGSLPTPDPEYVAKNYEAMAALEAEIAEEYLAEIINASMAGGEAGWSALPAMGISLVGSFDVENPYVVPAARQRVGYLIQEVRNGTNLGIQKAVADIIERSYTQKVGWRSAAKEIRGVVGLRPDQINAVAKIRDRLIEGGMKGERLTKRLARESAKRLRYRADMIARTEMARAVNVGRHDSWRVAQDRNLFGGRKPMVEWVAGITDRTCGICADLHGTSVPLGEDFSGTPLDTDQLEVYGETPPVHPLCRCTTILRLE